PELLAIDRKNFKALAGERLESVSAYRTRKKVFGVERTVLVTFNDNLYTEQLTTLMEQIQKRDPLVTWAWEPGNGRTLPPMSFEAFSAKVQEWVDNGGACPE
ncbi:MAG: hypothetical protein AAB325_14055, partial [Pseudomonadota bacterium]